MASNGTYQFSELPPDQRVLSDQRYRTHLYYAAQFAVWVGHLYFVVRLVAILSSPSQTWQAWMMFAVELMFAHLARKEQLRSIIAGKVAQSGPRKRLRLQGSDGLPRVDVLLPCCGEPVDVIMQTVRAACTLDYPISQFRVLLLDDGGSALLKKTVSGLQAQWPHLSYHSRGRQSGQVFAKSGNLNYALTTLQNEDTPEFCAVLDADSIPTPDFLRATLAHLLQNPTSSLVSTRQYFSNLPNGDPLSQARCHFYTCQNAELDILGRAIDAGSGAVFRRQAIVDVGLYPTFSFSEDWQLSLVLQGFGHRTMQVQEPLQYGLVPTSITGHIAQRNRWNIGHAQQMASMLSSNPPNLPKDLRTSIAWNGAGIVGGELGCLLCFAAIPILLLAGNTVPATSNFAIQLQLALGIIYLLSTWVYEFCQAANTGFQSAPFAHLENKWQAAGNIYSILRFYLLSSKPKGSFVTGSTANSWNRLTAMSAYMRIYKDLWQNGIFCNVIVLITTLGAIFYSTAVALSPSDHDLTTKLFTSIAWPPLLHVCYLTLANNWVPVAYLLDPPKYPDQKSESRKEEPPRTSTSQDTWFSMAKSSKASREMLQLGSRLEIVEETEL
ncbi:nucleotide-diphospho-sugar transferase [Penicillium verhagenii]|uniref:nucleotide-diphospho-sugar transferase n=1 Tax=Penicillium verhagenii TaxID=1562060 RepID=UPI002544E69D|nr:nucleotide-diphospho-sugar transferase [Penicillium verhagenii]KAJ5947460.1 nucleotide-diphospho-sugar transferase [Penicillium verhagenii]